MPSATACGRSGDDRDPMYLPVLNSEEACVSNMLKLGIREYPRPKGAGFIYIERKPKFERWLLDMDLFVVDDDYIDFIVSEVMKRAEEVIGAEFRTAHVFFENMAAPLEKKFQAALNERTLARSR